MSQTQNSKSFSIWSPCPLQMLCKFTRNFTMIKKKLSPSQDPSYITEACVWTLKASSTSLTNFSESYSDSDIDCICECWPSINSSCWRYTLCKECSKPARELSGFRTFHKTNKTCSLHHLMLKVSKHQQLVILHWQKYQLRAHDIWKWLICREKKTHCFLSLLLLWSIERVGWSQAANR